MADVVNARFDTINRLTGKIDDHFHKPLVHDLRVEIKKLRAFLCLARTEPGEHSRLKIRRRLKAFNGYIGIIRNIQLQQHLMEELVPPIEAPFIAEYMNLLDEDLHLWMHEALKLTFGHKDFDEERDVLLEALPPKLSHISVSRFVRQCAGEIESLLILRRADENNLHSLRGVIKNLLFNWNYLQTNAALLPPEMNDYERLLGLSDILGRYGDQCTGLDLLQASYLEKVTDKSGRSTLVWVRRQLEKRRDQWRREFFAKLLNIRSKEKTL